MKENLAFHQNNKKMSLSQSEGGSHYVGERQLDYYAQLLYQYLKRRVLFFSKTMQVTDHIKCYYDMIL